MTHPTNTSIRDEEDQWNGHKHQRLSSRISTADSPEYFDDGRVTVKTDIVVQVHDGRSNVSGGTRLSPEGGRSHSAGFQ